jgi:hypothetical protein
MRSIIVAAFVSLALTSVAGAGTTPPHRHCTFGHKVCGDRCIPKRQVCHRPCSFNQICNSRLPHL